MIWPNTRAILLTVRFFALPVYAGMKNKTGTFCPNKQKRKRKISRGPEKAGTRLIFFFVYRKPPAVPGSSQKALALHRK